MNEPPAAGLLGVTDRAGRDLGRVRVERVSAGIVTGSFQPGPDYAAVEPMFRHYADVVEQQSFSYLDAAEAAVARLGLAVRSGGRDVHPVEDVQLYPDGSFSCKLLGPVRHAPPVRSPADQQQMDG